MNYSVQVIESPSLRERQRLHTLHEIHAAALHLVESDGLAAATVDAIAERAGISRRTFFNYFATKEDAVLGTRPPTVPADALTQFFEDESTDRFTRTVRLIVAIIRSSVFDSSSFETRRTLAHRFPELKVRLQQHVSTAEGLLEAVLAEKFGTDAPNTSDDSAKALLMLSGTVIRFVYARDPSLGESDETAAIESAISTFRKVLQDIS